MKGFRFLKVATAIAIDNKMIELKNTGTTTK